MRPTLQNPLIDQERLSSQGILSISVLSVLLQLALFLSTYFDGFLSLSTT